MLNIAKTILINTTFIFFSSVLAKLINVLFIVYASRVLGPSNFGIYALIGTLTFLFSYFTSFGITPMGVREIARNRQGVEELFNNILAIRICFIAISYFLLYLTVNLLNYSEEIKTLVYISAISIFFSTFTSTFHILYMAFERMVIPSLVTVLNSIINTILGLTALYLGYGLLGVIWSGVFINVVGAILSGIWVRKMFFKYRLSVNLKLWIDLLKQALPFALILFFQQANRHLAVLFLSKLPAPVPQTQAVGLFNSASALPQSAMMVPASIRQALLPTISVNRDDLEKIKTIIDKITRYILIFVSVPLVVLTTFFSKQIITILFGKAYIESAPALIILGFAYALQAFNTSANVTLSSSRDITRVIPWVGSVTVFNVLLIIPLIYYYSFVGAAVAVLISMTVNTYGRYYLLKKLWKINVAEFFQTRKALISAVGLFMLCWLVFLLNKNQIFTFCLIFGLYTAYIYYLGIFSKDEQLFQMIVSKLRRKNGTHHR
ncbi:MAG: flippase [Candidatus Magnetoovum sp. WYHC-5]|nr:flippase [Candidatus Magnetoovum sp. WYHC-5]